MKHLFTYAFCSVIMAMGLVACGSDNDKDNNEQGQKQEQEQEQGNKPSSEARALNVSIDESGLTYDDLTIQLGNGTSYKYEHVPFGTVKVSIDDLPTSVAELQKLKLPNGMTNVQQSPYLQPILIVAALNMLNVDKSEARKMLDYLVKEAKSENRDGVNVHFPGEGATTVFATDWSQVNQYKKFDKVRSYLDGAKYANNYTPETKPYTMTMEITDNSYTADKDCFLLWLTSTQANSKRELAIWEYDSDGDGVYDTFWASKFLPLIHGLAEY